MNRVFAIIALLAAVLSASADEVRVAHFDAKRVFEQYQHTRDIEGAISGKRHSMGAGSYTPGMERRDKLKERINSLEQRKATAPGTAERERIELQLQIANLELQVDELRQSVESLQRARIQEDEVRRQRAQVIGEIWSTVSQLATERGCRLVVPDNLPGDGPFLSVVASPAGEDLTELLISRLNEQYAAANSK